VNKIFRLIKAMQFCWKIHFRQWRARTTQTIHKNQEEIVGILSAILLLLACAILAFLGLAIVPN